MKYVVLATVVAFAVALAAFFAASWGTLPPLGAFLLSAL